MARNVYGRSGHIEQTFLGEQNDGAIVCQACSRVIFGRDNLDQRGHCPFCHRSPDLSLSDDLFDDDDDDPIIAVDC